MRYYVLACDYDGTIAREGRVDAATLDALQRVAATGRKLVLVTGRTWDDLVRGFPDHRLFDRVVVENGAVLYEPRDHRKRVLGPPPPAEFVAELTKRGAQPLSVGDVIVATWKPFDLTVLESIGDLGLELQVIFNKGAVMVLPPGVNKRSGLLEALGELRLSPHNCVGIGDAENDHAFLESCEVAVAVANALPAVKSTADLVTRGDHGSGVRELADMLIEDDLRGIDAGLERRRVPLGTSSSGEPIALRPYGSVVLITGVSGGGKSTTAAAVVERLIERTYQLCLIDPEGDHEGLPEATVTGAPDHPPDLDHMMGALAQHDQNIAVNLLGVPMADRSQLFAAILTRLHDLRSTTGRPHWIVVDEAHHVLHADFPQVLLDLFGDSMSFLLVTTEPLRLHPKVLAMTNVVIAVGPEDARTIDTCAHARGLPPPAHPGDRTGELPLVWFVGSPGTERVTMEPSRAERRRHRRKYAEGELGPDKSFYFRGPDDRLKLRAQNLIVFNQIAEGVDDETWLFHLRKGDVASWFADAIKDDELATIARDVAGSGASASESRRRIREAVEQRYTLRG